jgi:hypothetical protein
MLGGWLHRDTCHTAATLLRGERRRLARERQAVEMNALHNNPEGDWAEVAPILDEAIERLSPEHRHAILLRFFEQRDFRSIGENLGTAEDAARMRVSRALEKLQVLLKHRGVAFSVATLGTTLATNVIAAAPAGLDTSITGVGLAGAIASGGVAGSLVKFVIMTKLKLGILAAVILFGMAIPLTRHYQAQSQLRTGESQSMMLQKARRSAHWLLALRYYAQEHNDQLPKSLDAVVPYLQNMSPEDEVELMKSSNQYDVSYPGKFEELASSDGHAIILREKQTWLTRDGKRAKVYGYADGSSQIHFEVDGEFAAWEKQHLPKPAKP